jgi:succinate dehydrogenase / fumarate reductase membrane anchor subunit
MRESTLQIVNYVMIAVLFFTVLLHLALHGFFGFIDYEDSLVYSDVVTRYRQTIPAVMLTVLLISASFHGLYGLRNILLEFRSGPVWDRAVSYGVLVAGIALVGWGMRTIVLTATGG